MSALDGMAAVEACAVRFELAVKAHATEEAREALHAMLAGLEQHFGELSRGERSARLLRGVLDRAVRCALLADDSPGMAEAFERAVQMRLLLTLHRGPL